jgi:hypothetical protein
MTHTGGFMMLTNIFFGFKKLWIGESKAIIEKEEFERLESKHTRVQFDVDIYEMIRVR